MKAGELRVRKGRLRAALLKKRFSSASAWKSRLRGRLPCTSKTTQACRALASLPRAPPPAPAAGAGVPGRYPAPCCHHHLLINLKLCTHGTAAPFSPPPAPDHHESALCLCGLPVPTLCHFPLAFLFPLLSCRRFLNILISHNSWSVLKTADIF